MYWIPYQEDINAALQELRQQEFESDRPYRLDERNSIWRSSAEEYFSAIEGKSPDEISEKDLSDFQYMRALREPANINELLRWSVPNGTHCIMDVARVSTSPEPFAVSPLSSEESLELFGTEKPTRDTVEGKLREVQVLRGRWQGVYVVVYKGGAPDEILFIGYSGD